MIAIIYILYIIHIVMYYKLNVPMGIIDNVIDYNITFNITA